jgi:hypothetical protein
VTGRRGGGLPDGDPRHGTYNGYVNRGCRCTDCRAANTAFHIAAREQRRGSLSPGDPRHGRDDTYTNYACRCDWCRDAHTDYRARRKSA